jgi:hypothetical protein
MSLTQITRTVVSSISSFFNINSSTGALTSVIPDLMPSNSTLYPGYMCRAWVNFNGTGTVAIRGSGNVSSITDNNTGDYTINFSIPMPDANYTYVFGANSGASAGTDGRVIAININVPPTSSALRIWAGLPGSISNGFGGNLGDLAHISVAVFR